MISKCLVAATVAFTAVEAKKDNFGGRTIDNLMQYMGWSKGNNLPEEQERIQVQEGHDKPPVVESIGWSTSKWSTSNTNRGYEIYINQDLGISYQFPLYNQDTYLVWRQRLHLYLGGRNYISIGTGFAKFNLYLDVWGANFTFLDNYMRYDIVNYGDFCQAAQWFLQFATVQTFMQIDVNQCIYGLLGWRSAATDDTSDCAWATYYINYPLFQQNFYNQTYTDMLMPSTCGEPIPPYETAAIVG